MGRLWRWERVMGKEPLVLRVNMKRKHNKRRENWFGRVTRTRKRMLQPRGPKPDWTSGSLLDQPVESQTDLFHEQINKLQQRKEAFICEKEIREVDFGPFGITDKFKALGWEAALKCYDNEVKIYTIERYKCGWPLSHVLPSRPHQRRNL
ncbi:hypothetical protein HanOQP8_Chr01g0006101 [Helianthus annuus]|nr:hypothetical protein HanOQP8_Chr01g0006101 [Helianthus annuus]